MTIVMLALDFYFAALLGVSGIAKLEHPEQFAATLRRHRLLPPWSVGGISRFFPWAEIAVASALIMGFAPVLTSSMVLIFFVAFLIVDSMLLATKRADECGCYGMAYTQKVDPASVTTSGLLLSIAAVHLWLTFQVTRADWEWRALLGIPLAMFGSMLALRVLRRRRQLLSVLRNTPYSSKGSPLTALASRLEAGDNLPVDLGISLPEYTFLLFVNSGCEPCIELCRTLRDQDLGEWSLVVVLTGEAYQQAQEGNRHFMLPSYAQQLFDPERRWFRELGLKATPTALALRNGQLIDQRIGADAHWFTNTPRDQAEREQHNLHITV